MTTSITSIQNPLIKQLIQYREKSRARKRDGLFLIEGIREIQLALKGQYFLQYIIYHPDIISYKQVSQLFPETKKFIEVSIDIYKRIAYRETTEGIIAVAKTKSLELHSLHLSSENPLLLIAEAPEKPGNIGALLRTADAAHVNAVIIANPKTDLYNPNIIRSSVGCIFTNQIAMANTSDIITYLKERNINIYCAALQASIPYHTQDFTKASAIVVGTEATGLSEEWLTGSNQNVIIPMQGEIDSMNVSVAAGILIFEAKRQRQFS